MPRETLCCLVVACAYGFVPAAVPRAPSALRETNPDFIVSDEMPKRWSKVHDCERPKRWREEYVDDEDCQGYVSGEEFERRAGAKSSPYLETIGTITTLDDFYAAVARSAESDRLFVLKFYSKSCRACLRIAAKYRRLALTYEGRIDCYEAELSASKPLFQNLDVQEVPSVQIFHGTLFENDLTRLASCRCKPADFKRVEAKIITAHEGIQNKRALMAGLCQLRRDRRGLARHLWVRTHDDLYDEERVKLEFDDDAWEIDTYGELDVADDGPPHAAPR